MTTTTDRHIQATEDAPWILRWADAADIAMLVTKPQVVSPNRTGAPLHVECSLSGYSFLVVEDDEESRYPLTVTSTYAKALVEKRRLQEIDTWTRFSIQLVRSIL